MNIPDQLRKAMDKDGRSRYALAKASAMDVSALNRFYWGERGLSLDALDRLCDTLGLELQPKRPTKKTRKKGRN